MMARLPVQSAASLARRLFHSASNVDALKRITGTPENPTSCISCLLWPLASPLLGNAAVGWAGTSGHAYHQGGGSSTDEESGSEQAGSSESNDSSSTRRASGTRNSESSGSSSGGTADQGPTAQLRDLQQSLQQELQGGSPEHHSDRQEALQLPEHVARIAMRDPLGVLISSLGVPLGISLKVNPSDVLKQHTDANTPPVDVFDWQEFVSSEAADSDEEEGSSSCSSSEEWSAESGEPSTSVPNTDMQRLRQELHLKTRRFARKLHSQQLQDSSSTEAEQAATTGPAADLPGARPGDLHQHLESIRALIRASADKWGTTQQSPAEIAQQIADSNRAAGGGGGGGDAEGGDDADDDDDEPLALSPGEERYADASTVAADLKELDEIFEVLAKVPWLDDEDVEERELRGLAAVGLLGTLEEVGWTIRDKLLALWAGERDVEVLTAGLGPREASAMTSILFHTQQLEEQYGKPPQQSVQAALAAAGSGGSWLQGEGGAGAGGTGDKH